MNVLVTLNITSRINFIFIFTLYSSMIDIITSAKPCNLNQNIVIILKINLKMRRHRNFTSTQAPNM